MTTTVAANDDPVGVMTTKQLSAVVELLYNQEVTAITKQMFATEAARSRVLRDSREAYDNYNALLDQEKNDAPITDNPDVEKVRQEIWKYVRSAQRTGLEWVNNMRMRFQYCDKIAKDAQETLAQFNRTREANAPNMMDQLKELAEDATTKRNFHLQATRAKLSKTSQAFSQAVKEEGLQYESLIQKYSNRRYPNTNYTALETDQKVLVMADVIDGSGRASIKVNSISKVLGAAAAVALLVALGMVIWDIVDDIMDRAPSRAILNAVKAVSDTAGAIIASDIFVTVATSLSWSPAIIVVGATLIGVVAALAVDFAIDELAKLLMVHKVIFETLPTTTDQVQYGQTMLYNFELPDATKIVYEVTNTSSA